MKRKRRSGARGNRANKRRGFDEQLFTGIRASAHWTPGAPLADPLHTPLVTGLDGVPLLMERSRWIRAMSMEVERLGLQPVLRKSLEFTARFLGAEGSASDISPERLQHLEASYRDQGREAFWRGWIDSTFRAFGLEPSTVTETAFSLQGVTDYLAEHGALISATAWKGYLARGRGVVHVVRPHSPNVEREAPPECSYISNTRMAEAGEAWPADTAGYIERYDPEEGMVVLYEHGERVTVLRLRGLPPPPEAFELLRESWHDGAFRPSSN